MTTFDTHTPGTFHLKDGLFFRKVGRHGGGPNGNRPEQKGYWTDVEMTKAEFDPATKTYNVIAQQLIDEGSWLSVVSGMGVHGEDSLTYGVAQALHRSSGF